MQPFDTNSTTREPLAASQTAFDAGKLADFLPGSCQTIQLPDGRELVLFNVNGEFHATDNSCPHRGAALASGILCGHVIECGLHGWQFDVRTGECLTVTEKLQTYVVEVEGGLIKIFI